MSKAMVQDAVNEFRAGASGQVVLVLQGGGALGAYQVGVYEALQEAKVELDWIIGSSIGAITRQQQTHGLRHVVSQLVRHLPDDVRKAEPVRELTGYGCMTQMQIVRLLAPRLENENQTKDIDFSQSGICMRREARYEATMREPRQAPWQGEFDSIEGVILHESMPDLAMAAE